MARRLRAGVRERDTVACLGGDEFTVVVHDLSDADALIGIGAKLVDALHQPCQLADGPRVVSASSGLSVFPDDGDDIPGLLKNADDAMYRVKQSGKNQLCCHQPRLQQRAGERQDFTLHYQPIVDVRSGVLVGAEVLVRYQHPERGLVGPLEFIEVAEASGLILVIGEWVLREAARQWRAWCDSGLLPPRRHP